MEPIANRYLDAVARISEGLYAQTNVNDAIHYTLSTAVGLVHGEGGAVLLFNSDNQDLVCFYALGEKASGMLGMSIPSDQGLVGRVFSTGRGRSFEITSSRTCPSRTWRAAVPGARLSLFP
jgi:hypothetical protein